MIQGPCPGAHAPERSTTDDLISMNKNSRFHSLTIKSFGPIYNTKALS